MAPPLIVNNDFYNILTIRSYGPALTISDVEVAIRYAACR